MGNCQKEEDQIRTIRVLPPKSELIIKCQTWNKDYQGLFDYQSKDVHKEEIKIRQTQYVFKDKRNIELSSRPCNQTLNELPNDFRSGLKFIAFRNPKLKGFTITSVKGIQKGGEIVEKMIWEVVKAMPNKKHILQQDDVIKLGRQRIKVKEMILKQFQSVQQEEDKSDIKVRYSVYKNIQNSANLSPLRSEQQQSQIVCRVCLDPGTSSTPLISACKCQGYLKYIHLQCLRMWLSKRLQPVVKAHTIIVNWKPLVCELCTSSFAHKIYLDGKKYYTIEIPRPKKPYIVLQLLNKSTDGKLYHMISLADKHKLKLGRKHDTDIRISDDISVSRNHATISFDSITQQFILEDNTSKFGTLVAQRKIRINEKYSTTFQVGPNLFSLKMIKGQDEPQKDSISDVEGDAGSDNENSYSKKSHEQESFDSSDMSQQQRVSNPEIEQNNREINVNNNRDRVTQVSMIPLPILQQKRQQLDEQRKKLQKSYSLSPQKRQQQKVQRSERQSQNQSSQHSPSKEPQKREQQPQQ